MPSDFLPTATIETLQYRAQIIRRMRDFFDGREFFEVHTPVLSSETVVDAYIDPIRVGSESVHTQATVPEFFLQSSPEFAMKRLLAAGARSIYQICPAFRAGEAGHHHNPEFTMLEWYRVGDTMQDGIELLVDLIASVVHTADCRVVSYQEAFLEHAGFDPLSQSLSELEREAIRLGITYSGCQIEDCDEWLNLIFDQIVCPNLGRSSPTVLTHYPESQAALARISDSRPGTSERFELFMGGVELANGYGELLDPDALLARSKTNNRSRVKRGTAALPLPQRLTAAMEHGLPTCSGCAMGVDRLVARLLGLDNIREVLAFPIDRA